MPTPHLEIVHRQEFSAAHRLHSEALSVEENREAFGPCEHVHGHNYVLEVAVRGPLDPRTGMVLDLNQLSKIVTGEIIELVDHRFLNEDVPFLQDVPVFTAENLAIAFWNRIAEHEDGWGEARLHRVRVMESEANFVDYWGPGN